MLTFINTNKLPRKKTPEGEMTEVLNPTSVGAKNILASLRWLKPGGKFQAEPSDKHQLIYLMEGDAEIHLEKKDYHVSKGAGVYLAPSETASIQASDRGTVKLLHLVVPKVPA